jgi:hypothetical protein
MSAEFEGLELDVERVHFASFNATLANMIIGYASESLVLMCGPIPEELLHIATYTLPWAVQLRNSYGTIFNMGGFLESDLAVLTIILNQYLSNYAGPDVGLVVSLVSKQGVRRPLPSGLAHNVQLPTLSLAREILRATFNGAFRAFVVPGPTLTS